MAKSLFRRGWKASCVGLALLAGGQAQQILAESEPNAIVPASATNMAVLDAMIAEAMQDGSLSTEERKFITGVARRKMTASDVGEVEARLATLPAAPVRFNSMSSTTTTQNQDAAAAAPAPSSNCNTCCDDPGCGGLFDNMYVFAAGDGWAGPIDDDDANNFGYRFGFNAGVPIDECRGIGAQFGMSYGVYNFHGREAGREVSSIEDQIFLSGGVFKRADLCKECPDRLVAGLVYDHMITDNTGEEAWEIGEMGQLRWQVGYATSTSDEVGLFGTFRLWDDEVDGPSNNENGVRALDTVSLYWHHHWCWSADTTLYIGIADDPGDWIFGAKGEVPLSNCVSLFGNVHYVLPSASGGSDDDQFAQEYWNVTVGVAYYPGCNAASKSVAGRRWMPLMPVADNGSFAIDVNADNL
jgi:hypothetical protein